MKTITLSLFCITTLFYHTINAQTVSDAINSFSGKASWNSATNTFTFDSTGVMAFTGKSNAKKHFWDVPGEVKTIVINNETQVTCAFHTQNSCTIKGLNRKTSVVYGTNMREWAQNTGVKAFEHCQFQNFGGTMTIQNLTSKNPFGFHVRGWGKTMMVSYCDFLDTRGGHGNHSDGIEGGDGSVIDNCYFETGDDIFKVYFDNLITNCTVNMVQNAVPIQMGWGNYSDGAVGTFKNLTIIGNSGRGNKGSYPIICGRKGNYSVTVNIDSCTIVNPVAHLVMLWDDNEDGNYEKTINGTITNAFIDIKGYTNYLKGTSNLTVCGTDERKADYNCLNPSVIPNNVEPEVSVPFPNPASNQINIETIQPVHVYNASGKNLQLDISLTGNSQTIDISNLSPGIYFIQSENILQKFIKTR